MWAGADLQQPWVVVLGPRSHCARQSRAATLQGSGAWSSHQAKSRRFSACVSFGTGSKRGVLKVFVVHLKHNVYFTHSSNRISRSSIVLLISIPIPTHRYLKVCNQVSSISKF